MQYLLNDNEYARYIIGRKDTDTLGFVKRQIKAKVNQAGGCSIVNGEEYCSISCPAFGIHTDKDNICIGSHEEPHVGK